MIRIAQIGVGYWGPNLLRNLVQNSECSIDVVAETSGQRREFVKKLYPGIRVVGSSDAVMDDDSIDAVVIATPVATHFDLVLAALRHGKHVLVEKPMAKSVQEVEAIATLAEEKGLVAMVGHTFLYNPAVRYLKQIVDAGDLGEIRYICSQRLNLGRIRSDVDALWNLAPHDVSIVQYLLDGMAPDVVRKTGTAYVQDGIDDVVFLDLLYPNKVMAHIHVSWLDPRRVRQLAIVGSKKMALYDDVSDNRVTVFDKGIDLKAVLGERMDFDVPPVPSFSHRSGDILQPRIESVEPLAAEVDHFIKCIECGIECLSGTTHALEVVGILERADREGMAH